MVTISNKLRLEQKVNWKQSFHWYFTITLLTKPNRSFCFWKQWSYEITSLEYYLIEKCCLRQSEIWTHKLPILLYFMRQITLFPFLIYNLHLFSVPKRITFVVAYVFKNIYWQHWHWGHTLIFELKF